MIRSGKEIAGFLKPDLMFRYNASGKRKDSYRYEEGGILVKALKEPISVNEAVEISSRLKKEQDLMRRFLGSYMINASFVVGSSQVENLATVLGAQDFVRGISIGRAIILSKLNRVSLHYVRDFLQSTLIMYSETGEIPDVAKFPWITPPIRTSNIIVVEREGLPYPLLVDTDFSKRTQNKNYGEAQKRAIARGVKNTLWFIQ